MDDEEDIDRFLYGDEADAVKDAASSGAAVADTKPEDSVKSADQKEAQSSQDEYEDDDDDDDVEFVLDSGEPSTSEQQKNLQTTSKSSKGAAQLAIDIDAVGTIGGQHIFDVDLDDPNSPLGLADVANRPWRKPGADITDYFNYGFNEHTWKFYCQKQRMLRGDPAFSSNSSNTKPPASHHQSTSAGTSFPSFGTQRGEESTRNGSRPSSSSSTRHRSRERSVERSSYDRNTSSSTRRPSADRSYQRRRDHSQEDSPSRSSRDRRPRRR